MFFMLPLKRDLREVQAALVEAQSLQDNSTKITRVASCRNVIETAEHRNRLMQCVINRVSDLTWIDIIGDTEASNGIMGRFRTSCTSEISGDQHQGKGAADMMSVQQNGFLLLIKLWSLSQMDTVLEISMSHLAPDELFFRLFVWSRAHRKTC